MTELCDAMLRVERPTYIHGVQHEPKEGLRSMEMGRGYAWSCRERRAPARRVLAAPWPRQTRTAQPSARTCRAHVAQGALA